MGCGTTDRGFSCVEPTSNLRGHRAIITALHVCFRVRIPCSFSNAGGKKWSDVEHDAKFRTFWPPAVKIRREMDEIFGSIVEALHIRPEYIRWPLRGCWARCIDNKMLSYRRETALQGALWFSPKVEHWNWETMIYGHNTSIFNHCDIISLKICRIP